MSRAMFIEQLWAQEDFSQPPSWGIGCFPTLLAVWSESFQPDGWARFWWENGDLWGLLPMSTFSELLPPVSFTAKSLTQPTPEPLLETLQFQQVICLRLLWTHYLFSQAWCTWNLVHAFLRVEFLFLSVTCGIPWSNLTVLQSQIFWWFFLWSRPPG